LEPSRDGRNQERDGRARVVGPARGAAQSDRVPDTGRAAVGLPTLIRILDAAVRPWLIDTFV